MATKSTSRVFAVWRAAIADLRAASWPTHPVTGIAPLVDFAIGLEYAGEAITMPGRVPQAGRTQWRTSGAPGQDETFRLLLGVTSRVSGTTAAEALDRIEALADVAQATFRSQTTGLPDGANLAALAIPTLRWIVDSPIPAIYPWPDGGFAADATFEIEFTARI